MNKKQRRLFGIAFALLFAGIALATTLSASPDVEIYAFDHIFRGFCEAKKFVLIL